jgi:hypothetical protein
MKNMITMTETSFQRNIILLLIVLFVPIFSVVAQNQKETKTQLQEDKIYYTPQLAGSSPTIKPPVAGNPNTKATKELSTDLDMRSSKRSSSSFTMPQLMAKINSAKQVLTDVPIYEGTADQRSPQIVSNGSEMYAVFENYDIFGGSFPYGRIEIYKSADGGANWKNWDYISSTSYHLYSPQIVLVGGDVIVSYQRNGALRTFCFNLAGEILNPDVPVPVVSTSEYVVDHKMVTDAQEYSGTSYLYMAYLFKQADGKNRVLFSYSTDTSRTWSAYQELGLSQSELGATSIGLDFSSSGLYLVYLGTDASAGSILMRKSTLFGLSSSWTPEIILPMNVNGGKNKKVGPMVAAIGQRVAVIYQYDCPGDATNWKTGSDFDVYADVSDDGGASWQERMVNSTYTSEILPNVTSDLDGNFYVSFIRDGKTRVSMAGSEFKFGISDSSSTANVSLDDFPSIYGSTISGTNTAYFTWTELSNSNGLDIYGAATVLKIPPLSPSDLVANVVSSSEIKLSWMDHSSDESGFVIYYRQTGTGADFAQKAVVSTDVTSYSVTGLVSSTGYDFYVCAFNANGLSLRTNIVSTLPSVTPPAPPTATAATNVQSNSFTANWHSVSNATGYRLDVGTNSGLTSFVAGFNDKDIGYDTSTSVTGLTANTTYYYRVRAYNINGTSTSSNNIAATTLPSIVNPPTITSFSPTSGIIGTNVTITGTNFDATPSNNIVYFGAVKATVNSGTSTSLNVSVPNGTTYKPITVTTNGLTAYSQKPFIITYTGGGVIDTASFAQKVDFPIGMVPEGINVGDMDGDGTPDILVTNNSNNTISILRNIGTNKSISFASKVDFNVGAGPGCISLGDLDGDGKLDVVVGNFDGNTISVLRNLSTGGNLNFATKVDYAVGNGPSNIAIGDIDGDGKPDVAVATVNSTTFFSIFRNISSVGSINFDSRNDIQTGNNPFDIKIADIDGDTKPDVVVTNIQDNNVSIFRNISTSGSMSFATRTSRGTVGGPRCVAIVDIDGDGKLDLTTSNSDSNYISVIRNMSASGSINMSSAKYLPAGLFPMNIAVGDIDGDGKPDILTVNVEGNNVSVFRNICTSGNVDLTSRVDFSAGDYPYDAVIVDINEDGKPDIIVSNRNNNSISVLRNTIVPPDIIPPIVSINTPTGIPVIVGANGQVGSSPQVSASASDGGSGISRMQVAYRNTSEQNWSKSPFESASTISFPIPTNKFVYNNKPIGVNYRVGAWDNAGNVTWSPYNSIDVQLGPQATDQPSFSMPAASQKTNKTTAYRIISVPYDLLGKQPVNLLSNFGDHKENDVSYARWRLQRYVNGQYQDYDKFSTEDAVIPGAAFFFIVRDQGSQISVKGESVVRSDIMYSKNISVKSGWNLIGNPFTFPYPIDSLEFINTSMIGRAYYSGSGNVGGWELTGVNVALIQPWQGIAIKVNNDGTMKFPSVGQRSGLPKLKITPSVERSEPMQAENLSNWMIPINAYRSDIDMRCEGGAVGMVQGASEGDDQYDLYIPPFVGDKNIAVYFNNSEGAMLRDIRPLNDEGGVWEMCVATGDAGARVKLQLGEKKNLPNPAFEAYLIDTDQKLAHNLNEVQSLEINSGNGVRNFRVVIGKKSFVEGNNAGVALTPSSMKLYANYPNPFNPETVIRYTVPDASASYTVTLKIFNVLGQEITTLVNEQKSSGYYEVKWNALQQSSGVYFYQLSITDGSKVFQEIKKMVLMK